MRRLCAAVLIFEAIVIGLAIAPAVTVGGIDARVAVPVGLALLLACVVVGSLLRHPIGYVLGWVLQAVMIGLGFVVPVMFFLGGVFALLWLLAIRLGRQVDQAESAPGA